MNLLHLRESDLESLGFEFGAEMAVDTCDFLVNKEGGRGEK